MDNSPLTTNPKSILNEFCQKKNISSPIYECEQVGGQSHNPLFISDVKFLFNNQLVAFRGNEQYSRKKAEISVAQMAIDKLGIIELLRVMNNTQKYELIIGISNIYQQSTAKNVVFLYKDHPNIFITIICTEQFYIDDETGINLKTITSKQMHENPNYVKNTMILMASRSTEQNIILYGGGATTTFDWDINSFCSTVNHEDNKPNRLLYINDGELLCDHLSSL